MIDALDIHVKGIVQGVGFRPFIYKLAKKYLINGWVLNAVDGVHIRAEGESDLVDEFVLELSEKAPAAAQVTEIELREVPIEPYDSFEIRFSDEDSAETTFVSPDLAICDECASEMLDPTNRRFRYPFINCTNCGSRFTIIDHLPYDRPYTSMKKFAMCSACTREYDDPNDRRFHAQPNACFECGPHISWTEDGGKHVEWGLTRKESDKIFASAVKLLNEGKIVAVKGLGGFHLACDANNAEAVTRLRERKHRFGKAFAVMVSDVDAAKRLCEVGDEESAVLSSSIKPIVLLKKRSCSNVVGVSSADAKATADSGVEGNEFDNGAPDGGDATNGATAGNMTDDSAAGIGADNLPHPLKGVADGLPELGVMLPYTPVQLLLMGDFAASQTNDNEVPALVMTSGNMHDEPICVTDAEAYERLNGIADAFIGNDRDILSRYDDSVVRVIHAGSAGEAIQMIRRARGYAPTPISFSAPGADIAWDKAAASDDPSSSTEPEAGSGEGALHEQNGKLIDPAIFAAGPEQKNTLTLLRLSEPSEASDCSSSTSSEANAPTDSEEEMLSKCLFPSTMLAEAFVSQHIGDMENADTFEAWLAAKFRMQALFELNPEKLACDLHPEYITSKWAHEQAALKHLPLTQVQHHHAHIASVMAESGFSPTEAVCGIAFDGTGYGADGNIWGGEVLLSNMGDYERFANFAYVPMPGGAAAIKHPLQMAYGVLWEFDLLEHPAAKKMMEELGTDKCEALETMIEEGLNTPVTSSVGRLFDAVSALLGVCTEPTYEGEPAIMLEAAMYDCTDGLADEPTAERAEKPATESAQADGSTPGDEASAYVIDIVKNTATPNSTAHDTSVILFDAANMFRAILDDMSAGVPVAVISRKFHDAFVTAIVSAAQLSLAAYDINKVVLSGGVFMNRYLIENAISALELAGFTVAINRELPPNDGCVSFGEAVVCLFQRN